MGAVEHIARKSEHNIRCVSTRSGIMSYQRSSNVGSSAASRRAPRPNSFSGTRSSPVSISSLSSTPSARSVYSSVVPSSYGSYSSGSGGWSTPSSTYPTTVSSYHSHPSTLTTYGGTASGYGSLILPSPNSNYPSSYHTYHAARAASPSMYSPRSSWSGTTSSYISSLPKSDFTPLTRSTSSVGSARSVASEGYISGGTDKSGPTSRLGSTSSLGDNDYPSRPTTPGLPNENGVLDYKKLYEEMLLENERLRNKLKKTEEELTQCKSRVTEPPPSAINKNSLSELEKREKRAMERKLSEMEEELKTIEHVKQENQRLKDENGALIRVISKLSK